MLLLVRMPDAGLLQHLNSFLSLFHFRVVWLPAEWWTWSDTIAAKVCAHPFLSLCGRHVGVWWVVLGVVLKLLSCFGGSEIRTVFNGTPYGTLHEEHIMSELMTSTWKSHLRPLLCVVLFLVCFNLEGAKYALFALYSTITNTHVSIHFKQVLTTSNSQQFQSTFTGTKNYLFKSIIVVKLRKLDVKIYEKTHGKSQKMHLRIKMLHSTS